MENIPSYKLKKTIKDILDNNDKCEFCHNDGDNECAECSIEYLSDELLKLFYIIKREVV